MRKSDRPNGGVVKEIVQPAVDDDDARQAIVEEIEACRAECDHVNPDHLTALLEEADADSAHATAAERVWRVVASIPAGRVATYGQVAELAGLPGAARRVGRVLAALPTDSRLPWHRVINAAGRVSLPGTHGVRQRRLLRAEGVYLRNQRVDLRRHRWTP